jgi:outer membrane lipoprotein SlyB
MLNFALTDSGGCHYFAKGMPMRLHLFVATSMAMAFLAQPACAQAWHTANSTYEGDSPSPAPYVREMHYGFDPVARDAWLADCHSRVAARDSGLGGAIIGGVVGGFAGNRIAGHGHRAIGTVAGAAVGAVAGAAIDKAEDRGRERGECEAYLDDYLARYSRAQYTYGNYGYGRGYAGNDCCMKEPECTETVEYVEEAVPPRPMPRKRYIPKPSKIVPDKRIKTMPDKRIPVS